MALRPAEGMSVLLTGATGFLGTTILEALLHEPLAALHVLVRGNGDHSAEQRLEHVLSGPAFAQLRERSHAGGAQAAARLRDRIHLLDGDLQSLNPAANDPLVLPHNLDLVINCASATGLDLPFDQVLPANVAGPAALVAGLRAAGANPHVVHLSTAYVQAGRTDLAYERPVDHEANWREELSLLEHHPDSAADPEASRARAVDLGWVDTYTYSKALGEDVLEELWGRRGHRLSVLRPSIIVGSVDLPSPSCAVEMRGRASVVARLVDAYARGDLTSLPATPEAVLDLIPVDAVVDTARAAVAVPPLPGRGHYYHVTTSTIAPLTVADVRRRLETALETTREDDDGEPARRPLKLRSPSVTRATLAARSANLAVTERIRGASPATAHHRRGLERDRRVLEVLGPYLTSSTRFNAPATSVLLAEYRSHGGTAMDLRGFDWPTYLQSLHLLAPVGEYGQDHRAITGDLPHQGAQEDELLSAVAAQTALTGALLVPGRITGGLA